MANNVKYLSYEGLEYFWNQKLKPIIEENEQLIAVALNDLNNKLNTHTHMYVASAGYSASAARATYAASAGYAATAARSVTSANSIYSASAGYSASAAQATYAASAGSSVYSASAGYSASAAQATYAASAGSSIYSASAGYSASAAQATYAASSGSSIYSASAGYSASAAQATYSASAGYTATAEYAATAALADKVILKNIDTASRSSYLLTADGEAKPIGDIMTLADAMVFKGTVTSNSQLPATHKQGWTYRVNTAGTYAGKVCEVGDLIICITDGTSANNAHWTVAQTNTDGVVSGPASSVSGNIAAFNSTNGKSIYNTGLALSNIATSGHTHSYLPLTGGILTGNLTINNNTLKITNEEHIIFDNPRYRENSGGWANSQFIVNGPADSDGNTPKIYSLGTYGSNNILGYIFIGTDSYSGDNLRIYPDGHIRATDFAKLNGTKVSYDGHTHDYLPLTGGTMTGIINSQSIIPTATNTYDLGSSSLRWNNIYGKTLYENGTSLANKYASKDHAHDASHITTGILPVNRGGTGLSTITTGHIIIGNGTSTPTTSKIVSITNAEIDTIFTK